MAAGLGVPPARRLAAPAAPRPGGRAGRRRGSRPLSGATPVLAPWLAALCAGAALVGFAGWVLRRSRRLARAGEWAGLAATLAALGIWVLRWTAAGHLPLFGTYESALSLALAVLLAAGVLRLYTPWARRVWPMVCTLAAALLVHGARFDPTVFPLTISERSWVVEVHAVLAWAAFGALAVNLALAAWIVARGAPRAEHGRARRDVPESWLGRTLSLGFALHSAMLVSGSFYKFLLFGKAWTFDPVETLGFVAWLAYGTLLHLHLFAAWDGRRLAAWCVGLFVLLVISYRGIVYFPPWSTYHIFDMDLRMHVTGEG